MCVNTVIVTKHSKLPKVVSFLESIGRNSLSSKKSYASSLTHFNNFIIKNYPNYDCQNILDSLSKNEINVHEVLDSFISYLLQYRDGITPKSVSLYMTSHIPNHLNYTMKNSALTQINPRKCPHY